MADIKRRASTLLERFQDKWIPVIRLESRQNEDLEHFREPIKIGHASGAHDNLHTLANTTALVFLRLISAISAFLLLMILSRTMPPDDLGLTLRLLSLSLLIGAFCALNTDIGAMPHMLQPLIRGRVDQAAGFIHFTRRVFFRTTPIATLLFFALALAPDYAAGRLSEDRIAATCLAAMSIPILGYTRLHGAWGYAMRQVLTVNFFGQFARNFLVTAVFAVFFFRGNNISVVQFFALHLLAALLVIIAQTLSLRRTLSPVLSTRPLVKNQHKLLMTGIYLLAAALPYDYLQNLAVTIAAFTMTEREVGVLAVVLRFVPFLLVGIFALNAAIDPKIAAAFALGDREAAQSKIRFSNLVKLGPTVIITGLIWALAPDILALFGPRFLEAANALRIAALLPCVTLFFGPSVLILNAAGQQRAIFVRSVIGGVFISGLVAILGFVSGVTGAVFGAVIGVVILELLLALQVQRCLGINATLPATIASTWPSRTS